MSKLEYKPDCGYAWVVVAACFSINFIMAGLARVAGVLYMALINTYGVSREVATTPFSLRFCIRNMSGPLVGAFGQRFGIRPVVLLGGIVCGIGAAVCAVAPTVTWITIAWGGIHGLGYGMCNIIHVIILNRYFEKYKGVAIGIALAGDCIGTFLLPILLEYLLCIYDLKGTFLILAGISLNVVPAAMLLISPPWQDPTSLQQDNRKKSKDEKSHFINGIDNIAFENDIQQMSTNQNSINNKVLKYSSSIFPTEFNGKLSRLSLPLCSENNELWNIIRQQRIMSIPDICFNDVQSNGYTSNACPPHSEISKIKQTSSLRILDKTHKNCHRKHNFPLYEMNQKNIQISVLGCPYTHDAEKSAAETLCKSVIKDNMFYPVQYLVPDNMENVQKIETFDNEQFSSKQHHDFIKDQDNGLLNIPCSKNDHYVSSFNHQYVPIPVVGCGVKPIFSDEKDTDHKGHITVHEPNALSAFCKTNVKPIFLLISATMALYVFLFIAVFTIIIDYASDNNIPSEQGKYLLLAFSVTDLFGRLGFGVVLDRQWIALAHYAGLTTAFMGLFVFIIPFSTNFILWVISFSLCGLVQGGTAIMYPILVNYYMEKHEEPIALGCLNFYGGLLMLPIPPMIGYFRDIIGTYDGVFWTTGGLCIFAGSLWLLEPCLVRLQPKKEDIPECI